MVGVHAQTIQGATLHCHASHSVGTVIFRTKFRVYTSQTRQNKRLSTDGPPVGDRLVGRAVDLSGTDRRHGDRGSPVIDRLARPGFGLVRDRRGPAADHLRADTTVPLHDS